MTALKTASSRGHLDIVRLLLDRGASIEPGVRQTCTSFTVVAHPPFDSLVFSTRFMLTYVTSDYVIVVCYRAERSDSSNNGLKQWSS